MCIGTFENLMKLQTNIKLATVWPKIVFSSPSKDFKKCWNEYLPQ